MSTLLALSDALTWVHANLPPFGEGDELILRPDADEPTATLRRESVAPQIFSWRNGACVGLNYLDDPRIPGTALLRDRELLNDRVREFTGEIAEIRVVAWRTGRRIVARLRSAGGEVFWLKLLDGKSHRRAARAFAAVRTVPAPLHFVLPTHALPDLGAFLTPTASGTALRALLARGERPPLTLLTEAVSALAATVVADELPAYTFESARAAAINMLEKASVIAPDMAELAARLRDLAGPPAPGVPGFVHGDLHDKQIFLTATAASLIDLEGMAIGDSRFDAINLVEHLRLRDLQQRGVVGPTAELALAALGFEAQDRATLAFRVVVRARLCGVYALRPRWRELVTQLHNETAALLQAAR